MDFSPRCLATAIGSFPHKDAAEACDLILRSIPDIPVWPQLPAVDFREGMEIQYSEGLPCVVIDDAAQVDGFDHQIFFRDQLNDTACTFVFLIADHIGYQCRLDGGEFLL